MAVSIVIFEDNARLRESLTILLDGVEGYTVAGGYDNCAQAATVIDQHRPDIVIMDAVPEDFGSSVLG